jgi:hypothetical protein
MEHCYTLLFRCDLGQYTFRYLGIPMHHKKLRNAGWKIIEDKFENRLRCYKGKLLYYGGRLVLINTILSSFALFLLSFFEIPKGILHKLDYYRSNFLARG